MSRSRREILKALAVVPLATLEQRKGVRETFIFETAPFPSCHASTIVEAEDGRFLAAWFGGTREKAKDVAIWLSRHDGRRWFPPERVAQEPDTPCWNPVLYRREDGEILLFYKAGPSPDNWSGFIKRSNDGGRKWSEAEILPAGLLGPIKNKPIAGRQNEIIAGTSVESYNAWSCWTEVSRDGGKTWSKHGPIVFPGVPQGIIQPTVWWTKNNKLRILARSTQRIGFICMAESPDGGHTWGPATTTALPNPNSGIDAVKLSDGRVLAVYNHTSRGRTPLNIAVSQNDGETWEMRLTLEDQPGEYSYPAVIQSRSGDIHVTYTWKRERIKHVVIEEI